MKKEEFRFEYDVYDSIDELPQGDKLLLQQAREVTANAYAPYSRFHVAAVAELKNGETITGTNQENASYPVGLCAERVLLSSASALFPNVPINTLAISYNNNIGASDHPISPCGLCRQTLLEYEGRVGQPIRVILGGMEGEVYVIKSAAQLLPLSFTSNDMK